MEVMMMMSSCTSHDHKTTLSPSPLQIPSSCLSPHHHHDTTCSSSFSQPSSTPGVTSTPPSPPTAAAQQGGVAVVSPCAACKILRRRCSAEKCVLAPYFPPTDPIKFATAHKVFGASNIIKLLQELPERERADAVSSMVYEANARVRDPVYGTAGAICNLQKQVGLLQAELAKSQAELLTLKSHQSHLLAMLCMNLTPSLSPPSSIHTSTTPIDHATTTTTAAAHIPNYISNSSPPTPVHDQDYSEELDSPMSDGFLNFYPDASTCNLLSWELL